MLTSLNAIRQELGWIERLTERQAACLGGALGVLAAVAGVSLVYLAGEWLAVLL